VEVINYLRYSALKTEIFLTEANGCNGFTENRILNISSEEQFT
jgi:hypothetical protein